jgi:ABC-2 type transport system ATP-binding protein
MYSGKNKLTYDIDIRGLVKRYGEVSAVNGFDLHVDEGEMLGLIGPDGAGKTTTLRILCGLIVPDAGSCRVAGYDAVRETASIRTLIGYMPQRFSLYPDLTVEENLRFFADLFRVEKSEREKRLKRLLAFNRLAPFAKRRASALSGGMKQKLALSCSLIHTPKVLLLDEPTTGVDPVSRREFWDILGELKKDGVTVLVSTPYMDEAARCDRVAFMHMGRLLHADTPDALPKRFPYTLIEMTCEDRLAAAKALADSGRFRNVQVYGDRIHLSGEGGADALARRAEAVLASKKMKACNAHSVRPGIEDVFVELLVPDSPAVNPGRDGDG